MTVRVSTTPDEIRQAILELPSDMPDIKAELLMDVADQGLEPLSS